MLVGREGQAIVSYDIYLDGVPAVCPACGNSKPEPSLSNPTYNLTPLFDYALTGETLPNPTISEGAVVLFRAKTDRPRGLRLLSGRIARDTVLQLQAANARLSDPEESETLHSLEPSNGWGDLARAKATIQELLSAAEAYPDHKWRIH
jgi:hypothetical protein